VELVGEAVDRGAGLAAPLRSTSARNCRIVKLLTRGRGRRLGGDAEAGDGEVRDGEGRAPVGPIRA
jgi:hypothetical protein